MVGSQDLKSHDMTTVWDNTHKIAKSLTRFARKRGVINGIENRLVPMKTEEGTDINRDTEENSKGNSPAKGLTSRAVKDKADILETK
jgi:hypothetical protein